MPTLDMYLRLSESDDASTAIARQEADLRALFDREGWSIGEIFVDDGLSGGYTREKAELALARVHDGESDGLAVWKFDRWSRQGIGAVAKLIEALDANPRALFVADRDGLRSTQPAWRIIASVLAEVARMERENTQLRVRSSIAALKKSGRYSGGTVPYGYRSAKDPDGPGRVLVVDEAEAAVVREAASRMLAGESMYRITTDLNARNVAPRRTKRWTVTALRQVLTGDAIVGRVTHDGELLRDADGLPLAVWAPVLDLATWHTVRAALDVDKPGSERVQRRRRSRLLSGIVRCGECDRPLYVKYNGQGQTSYGCSARSNGQPCAGVSISAGDLEEYVTRRFLDVVGDLEVFRRVEEAPDMTALAEVEAAITATATRMTSDDADVAELSGLLKSLKARRAELKAMPTTRVVRVVGTGWAFRETWEQFSSDAERNQILAANVAVLTVRKGKRVGRGPIDFDGRVTLVCQPAHVGDGITAAGRVYAEAS